MSNSLFPDYQAGSNRLVCIDSDGCVFDTMEIKHKECFCPATIHAWNLQAISKYVRESWEYVNLYSKSRGCSRFHAILQVFDLLAEREEIRQYGVTLPDIEPLRHWVETAPLLNNTELGRQSDHPVLKQALVWSLEMNQRAADMVFGIPPFPGVRESLTLLEGKADLVVVSATPREALEREWEEHGIRSCLKLLCAQEDGTKRECIAAIAHQYLKGNVLMMGDAPGDQAAAKANDILFYPIRPGEEIASWRGFQERDGEAFLRGDYTQERQRELVKLFDARLPDTPPWR